MKATIHTELRCGSCGQMMQYHQDTKVRCSQLKCKERNKEYHAPKVELYRTNTNACEVRARQEEASQTPLNAHDISQIGKEYDRALKARMESDPRFADSMKKMRDGATSPSTLSSIEGAAAESNADGSLALTPTDKQEKPKRGRSKAT